MKQHRIGKIGAVIFALVTWWLFVSAPSFAAPPLNDNFASATLIAGPSFTDVANNTEATLELAESQPCSLSGRTVWYVYAPTETNTVIVNLSGSSFPDTNLAAYHVLAPGLSGLSLINCTSFGGSLTFVAQAGETYYFQAGDLFTGGGALQFNFQVIPALSNDNFANATVIPALPYTNIVDTSAATVEAGERLPSCAASFPSPGKTAWYSFTPTTSGSISAGTMNTSFPTMLAAYTGNALTSLSEVGCAIFSGKATFLANAGTTYFFQLGGFFGDGGLLTFNLETTPPPTANFYFYPSDPSAFDNIQFCDSSNDPGQKGFQPPSWDFGDGATANISCAFHQYASDGDYTVSEVVTTLDGRTASTSSIVPVRTHDVAITRLSAPQAARVGQTRPVTVEVKNTRYPETVQVQLLKSVPGQFGGFQAFGTLTQAVPVRTGNRTTSFGFNYTFTQDDATVGKVSFKAIATIVDKRDALTGDNEAISAPTKVSR